MKVTRALMILVVGLFCAGSFVGAQQPVTSPDTGSNGKGQPTPSPHPAGKALIYVYRPGSMVGAANHPAVFVNDDFLANLHNSEYASREVPPGTVIFSFLPKSTVDVTVYQALANNLAKKKKEVLRIEAEPGKSYYFEWSYGGFGGFHPLKLVDEAAGAKEVSKLHSAKN
jgi:Protein of unknown function (DUF2846)